MSIIVAKNENLIHHTFNKQINNETMDRYGIERQSLVAMEELSELQVVRFKNLFKQNRKDKLKG